MLPVADMKYSVYFYYLPNSTVSEVMRNRLEALQASHPFDLISVNLLHDKAMHDRFAGTAPVVRIGGADHFGEISTSELDALLSRQENGLKQETVLLPGSARSVSLASGDKLSLWLARNYIHVFNALIFVYVGLAFLAPVLMKANATFSAKILYRGYSIVCHQLAFRSWFLFGQQAFYPRELAGMDGVVTYEEATGLDPHDLYAARDFVGNNLLGYKSALCQRDLAIYASMLLFGLFFWLSGRKLKPLPWYLWILLGLVPIGLDGLSQLPDILPVLPGWLFRRESTPFLRTLTGSMFGVSTTWFLYPMIEKSMRETVQMVRGRMAIQKLDIDLREPRN